MFQPLKFGVPGNTQKDSLDFFKERYNQPSDYSIPNYLPRNSPTQLTDRLNGNSPY